MGKKEDDFQDVVELFYSIRDLVHEINQKFGTKAEIGPFKAIKNGSFFVITISIKNAEVISSSLPKEVKGKFHEVENTIMPTLKSILN